MRVAATALLAALAVLFATAPDARAGERIVTGTLRAGASSVQSFTATATGPVAVWVEWDAPSANLNVALLRRGGDGVYRTVASGSAQEMPEVIVYDTPPGAFRVRVWSAAGSTAYTLRLRYPTAAPPVPKPGYVTLAFGRAQIGTVNASCAPLPGTVSLFAIADLLEARGIVATLTATIAMVGTCNGGVRNATWGELATFRDTYGWSVSSRGKTNRFTDTLTPAEQRDETCGSLPTFAKHGHTRGWGMFAYPSGFASMAAQLGPVQECFSYGRLYELGSNPYPAAAPYLVKQLDIGGGRCRNSALACYRIAVRRNRWYTPPRLLAAYANAGLDGTGRWALLQWYRFVTGRSGAASGAGKRWDCTSPETRNHWTSEPELYCLNDFLWVVDHIDRRVKVTDPATLGAAQGRGR
jgi:hypothetical protein